ncbi:hypothetical protein GYB59_16970 [bacterium]|nr:hypothetical protein [bacterium]
MRHLHYLLVVTFVLVGCGKQPDRMEQAKTLEKQGQFQEAVDIYQSVLVANRDQNDMAALNAALSMYLCQMELQQYTDAAKTMTDAIQLARGINEEAPGYTTQPMMARLYESRGKAHKLAGDTDAADRDFTTSSEIKRDVDQQVQAIEDFEDTIRNYPLEQKSEGSAK